MASKNVHDGSITADMLDSLGFTDMVTVGFCTNSEIVDIHLSESLTQYDKRSAV